MAYERREVVERDDPYDRTEAIPPVHETEVVERRSTAAVDRHEAVAYDPYANRRIAAEKLVQAIYLIFGLIETLLLIRFVLRALGANPNAGFAQFIYGITGGLVAPFVGLFGSPSYDGSVLELNSLVALIVYALLGWLIAKIVWLLIGESRSAVTTRSSTLDTHVH